ncbi:MAG: hypothetical protein Q9P90_00385 [candidate division KSB1 bacterium]|nr:hypothetical protein [candidate division KSB1 bacterium]
MQKALEVIDLADFDRTDRDWPEKPAYLVVKSLDQSKRRKRMIEAKKRNRIGRIEPRPVAKGLLVKTLIQPGRPIDVEHALQVCELREPRGLVEIDENYLLIAEIGKVFLLNRNSLAVEQTYQHPFFGFLHSLDFDPASGRFLVVSSGYDCLLEFDHASGESTWEWFFWEHGFHTLDGTLLVRDASMAKKIAAEGRKVRFIQPEVYGEQGILTSERTNHPNSACYDPHNSDTIYVTLGHSGEILRINKRYNTFQTVFSDLGPMPHGIQPLKNGWAVTDTTRGAWLLLDKEFEKSKMVLFHHLPEKHPDAGDHEWIQNVLPYDDNQYLAIDANRGLIMFNLQKKKYCIIPVESEWCIHHLTVNLRK